MKVRHRSEPEQSNKPVWCDGPRGDEDRASGAANAKTGGESLAALTNSTTRRGLFRAGAGLAAAVSGITPGLAAPAVAADAIKVPNRPNIIVLMTDQERHHMHWPQGWAEKNLPGLQRLEASRPLLQPGLHRGHSMLALTRGDDDRPVRPREPGDPDLSVARPGAPGSPTEYRLAAQGQSGLRSGLERQMAPELRRQHRETAARIGRKRHRRV